MECNTHTNQSAPQPSPKDSLWDILLDDAQTNVRGEAINKLVIGKRSNSGFLDRILSDDADDNG